MNAVAKTNRSLKGFARVGGKKGIRNAWLQRREYQIKDGNVDDQSLELEEEFMDDPDATPAPETDEAPAPAEPAQPVPPPR